MNKRYQLRRRAERQAETRRRIVEAAVDLHTTLGPARTSIKAIAERAGVQRHTVYAHFADTESLFGACSSHWQSLHPYPAIDPAAGLGAVLEAIYGWYDEVEHDFALFVRDTDVFPKFRLERERNLSALAVALAAQYGKGKVTRAAVGHALAFETWRSLVRDERLSRHQAVDAMVRFVESV